MLKVFSKKTNFVLMGIIVGFSIGMSIHQAFGDTTSVPGTLQGDSLTVNTSGQYTNGLIVANGNAVVAGNVGIGTTLPSVKLDVLGDIKSSTKICVGATCIDETQLKAKLRVKTLSITKSGTGDGTIISSPDGINCGAVCASNFSNNISIILTASPAIGSVFASWGGACSGTGNCTITLSDDKTVTATFTSTATTVNGVCSTTAETCTSGTYSNSPDDTATNYQWTCLGAGSPVGTDSGTCTAVISSAGACGDKVAFTYNNSSVTYGIVTDADGKCWMDRNLGATQVATSSTDTASYGHLFQWGRDDDGHQVTTSGTTSTNADIPGNNLFITEGSSPYDWRVNQDGTLWANSSSTNNPCPANWHVPTQTEWATWVTSAGVTNSATAYNSTLKLPLAGYRGGSYLNKQGSGDFYWSSSPNGTSAYHLYFDSGAVSSASSANRAFGLSVRCVKDTSTVPTTQSLTITKSGTGSGTVTSEPTGSTFTSGLSVTLTATPNAGSTFAGWSGDCSGTALACTVVMSSDKSVTATFTFTGSPLTITTATPFPDAKVGAPYSLTLTSTGGNGRTVWSLPFGSRSLPEGLVLDPDTGVISGTPAVAAGGYVSHSNINLTRGTELTGIQFSLMVNR